MKEPDLSRMDWKTRIKKPVEGSAKFLSHWNFKNKDGTPYYTIDPHNIPDEWINQEEPRSVFDVPEIWYGVERLNHPDYDNRPWHEVEFCRRLWDKYADFPMEYILEACCGICPHGSILSRRGISVVGVDASQGMVDAANARAEIQDLEIRAYRRDVFRFSIPGSSPDGAILLASTFPVPHQSRTDNSALISQLKSVGYYIRKGGLYMIDCGSPTPPDIVRDEIVSQTREFDLGFARVSVRILTFRTRIDTWETPFSYYCTVKYPGGEVKLMHHSSTCFITTQHLLALLEMSGIFELLAFHHWGDLKPGLRQEGGNYVAVLRRK